MPTRNFCRSFEKIPERRKNRQRRQICRFFGNFFDKKFGFTASNWSRITFLFFQIRTGSGSKFGTKMTKKAIFPKIGNVFRRSTRRGALPMGPTDSPPANETCGAFGRVQWRQVSNFTSHSRRVMRFSARFADFSRLAEFGGNCAEKLIEIKSRVGARYTRI